MVAEAVFTVPDVIVIVTIAIGLTGNYWLLSNKIDSIKHDTRLTRAWHNSDDGARDKLNELHDWHNMRDDDGVPVWYVRKSLETVILEMAKSTNNLVAVLENINRDTKHNTTLIEQVLKQQQNEHT